MPKPITKRAAVALGVFALVAGSVFFPSPPRTQATAPTTNGLVGYWSFDEGSGTTALDTSGNGNNGTLSGATWTTGKVGGALSFDGNSANVVTIPAARAHKKQL